MGREVRRVPPNWQHPKRTTYDYRRGVEVESYQPIYNRDFAEAMDAWYATWKKWEAGERDEGASAEDKFWDWCGAPPDPEYHLHNHKPEECTWYQAYETVSEGTPVSPPFATQEELAEYLAANGDFWDQRRIKEGRQDGLAGWGIENASRFVGVGWAPSMIISNGVISTARDGI